MNESARLLQMQLPAGVDEFTAILILSGAFLIWYLTGSAYNRRLLRRYGETFRSELERRGVKVKIRQVGAAGLVLAGRGATEHLEDFTLSVAIVGRQNPVSMLANRLTGRGDVVTLKGNLKTPPTFDLELLHAKYPLTSSLLNEGLKDWYSQTVAGTSFTLAWRWRKPDFSPEDFAQLRRMDQVQRISLRTTAPHLLVNVKGAATRTGAALGWLSSVERLVKRIGLG